MKKTVWFILIILFFGGEFVFQSCQKKSSDNLELQEQGGGANDCQCVAYVKHQLQITTSTANAKDWGVTYFPAGFQLINSTPQIGDLIVLTPGVGSYFSSSSVFLTYGHIGIIQTIEVQQNNALKIGIKAANQGGKDNDCGCPNVNVVTFTLPNTLRDQIRVYRKTNPYLCFTIPNNSVPSISLSPSSISFGNVNIGTTISQSFSIQNTGNAPLIISNITSNNASFNSSYSGTISVGQTVQIPVSFAPTSNQSYSGQLTINSNASTATISLTGTGITNTPCNPTCSPVVGNFAQCESSSVTCSFSKGIITARVVSINCQSKQITLEIKKCNGTTFSNGGNLYVMSDLCASTTPYNSVVTFNAGQSTSQLTITENNMTGTKNYYVVISQAAGYSTSPVIQITY
jgi:hypothetical protein